MSESILNHILEIFYILIGLQLLYTAFRILKSSKHHKKYGTALFWILLAITFIVGPYITNVFNGIFILMMGALTLFKQVTIKNIVDVTEKEGDMGAQKYGNKLFIPALILAIAAIAVSMIAID